jgi:hypothetical protein
MRYAIWIGVCACSGGKSDGSDPDDGDTDTDTDSDADTDTDTDVDTVTTAETGTTEPTGDTGTPVDPIAAACPPYSGFSATHVWQLDRASGSTSHYAVSGYTIEGDDTVVTVDLEVTVPGGGTTLNVQTWRCNADGLRLQEVTAGGTTARYDPPILLIPAGVQPGDVWDEATEFSVDGQVLSHGPDHFEALDLETVDVPAGQFPNALPILRSSRLSPSTTNWYDLTIGQLRVDSDGDILELTAYTP